MAGASPRGEPTPNLKATIQETLPNAMFRVRCETGEEAQVHLAGAMRVQMARLVEGDEVLVQLSPLDNSKGRITGRP